jgi:hypothetical protein
MLVPQRDRVFSLRHYWRQKELRLLLPEKSMHFFGFCWIFKMLLVCLLVPKEEEDHFLSGIAGIVELINCTWKLTDTTVLYFL